jgi:hypothetical protein
LITPFKEQITYESLLKTLEWMLENEIDMGTESELPESLRLLDGYVLCPSTSEIVENKQAAERLLKEILKETWQGEKLQEMIGKTPTQKENNEELEELTLSRWITDILPSLKTIDRMADERSANW